MMRTGHHLAEKSYSMDNLSVYNSACMSYPYTLPPLAYAYNALDPHIDEQTMRLHHDKHHQAYIDNANKIVEKHPELQTRTLVEIMTDFDRLPADIRKVLRGPGGGHLNHSLFWDYLAPQSSGEPQGKLAQSIKKTFDGFVQFKEQFNRAAVSCSGSGWAWLWLTPRGGLEIGATANQDTPLSKGNLPILGLDVWEHAYYLKYHNRRPDYVMHWWQVVNWKKAEEQFEATTG